jgi:DNA-binding transcriptional MerR regulator
MKTDAPSLSELAAASGVEARTIRSWVAQGLLPAPLNRGPAARYPAETLERILAICAMRETLGMPMAEIRRELLVASPDKIEAYALKARGTGQMRPAASAPDAASALDYIGSLRAQIAATPAKMVPGTPPSPPIRPPGHGFEALENRLGEGRRRPLRKSVAENWLRIPITPDVALSVRGPLEPEQQVQLERCADYIRDILLGRDK